MRPLVLASLLRKRVGNLDDQRTTIINALDFVLQGCCTGPVSAPTAFGVRTPALFDITNIITLTDFGGILRWVGGLTFHSTATRTPDARFSGSP